GGEMVSGRPIPFPARWPAPELATSRAQLQEELAPALSELHFAKLSGPSSGGFRHEPVPTPAPIDCPGRRTPAGSLLPFRARGHPATLGVPLAYRFDRCSYSV